MTIRHVGCILYTETERERQIKMMDEKMAIVNELVVCGYCLMNRTAESMAEDFDVATLKMFLENFKRFSKKA